MQQQLSTRNSNNASLSLFIKEFMTGKRHVCDSIMANQTGTTPTWKSRQALSNGLRHHFQSYIRPDVGRRGNSDNDNNKHTKDIKTEKKQ